MFILFIKQNNYLLNIPPIKIIFNIIYNYYSHCFFIGNCVGIRNYKYFVGFVTCGMLMGIFFLYDNQLCLIKYFSYMINNYV